MELSIASGKIPVAPGCHFLMGGIVVDSVGKTSMDGLYAIGETACTGVHGANRLASNSLLEALHYGEKLAKHFNELPDKKWQSEGLYGVDYHGVFQLIYPCLKKMNCVRK